MSAAKPISHSAVLLALTAVAALGFWMGFRDSFMASAGIRSCTPASASTLGGANVPLATPMTDPLTAEPAAEVKAEPEKKKPEPVKADDPGTETHELPKAAARPPVITPPPPATPAAPEPTTDPAQQPPPY